MEQDRIQISDGVELERAFAVNAYNTFWEIGTGSNPRALYDFIEITRNENYRPCQAAAEDLLGRGLVYEHISPDGGVKLVPQSDFAAAAHLVHLSHDGMDIAFTDPSRLPSVRPNGMHNG